MKLPGQGHCCSGSVVLGVPPHDATGIPQNLACGFVA